MQQKSRHTFRNRFYFEISVSQTPKARVEKGIVDGEFYALKIIQSTESQELFYRKILSDRQQVAAQLYCESLFVPKVVVETVIDILDQITGESKTYLHIFSPYVPATNLCKYVSMSPLLSLNPINFKEKCNRIQKIVEKAVILLMSHTHQQLYTFNTFLFDENLNELHINTTSFAGMGLLLYDLEISQAEFIEIFELLGTFTLKKQLGERFSLQMKFRALGMLILNMVIEKPIKIYFDKNEWHAEPKETYLQKYKRYTSQSMKKFESLLGIHPINQKIKKIGQETGAKYLQFLEAVFLKEQQLTWTEVINLFIPRTLKGPTLNPLPPNSLSYLSIAQQMYKFSLQRYSTDIFDVLGLKKKNEMKLYFLSLLADQDTQVEQLLKYQNLDEYIYNPRNYNMQNRSIYKKIMKIVGTIAEKNIYPQAEKYCRQVYGYEQQYFESFAVEREQDNMKFQDFLKQVSFNFGVHRTTIRNKNTLSWAPETKGIRKYHKIFK